MALSCVTPGILCYGSLIYRSVPSFATGSVWAWAISNRSVRAPEPGRQSQSHTAVVAEHGKSQPPKFGGGSVDSSSVIWPSGEVSEKETQREWEVLAFA